MKLKRWIESLIMNNYNEIDININISFDLNIKLNYQYQCRFPTNFTLLRTHLFTIYFIYALTWVPEISNVYFFNVNSNSSSVCRISNIKNITTIS